MNQVNGPTMIMALHRFAAERDSGIWMKNTNIAEATGKRVAIVGSGPAGLTAAYYLAKLGHWVTVFEALAQPGGMMRVGIPEYRLPRDVLDAEIDAIKGVRVEIKVNSTIESLDRLIEQGYDAVFLATGAHRPLALNVEGMSLAQVFQGLHLLKDRALGRIRDNLFEGKRVVVIGGGNVAIDAARTALRLGAKELQLACLECRQEMPAHAWDIQCAEEEGTIINCSWGPRRILGRGNRVSGVDLVRCTSVFDGDGRFNPSYDETAKMSMEADAVIIAIGQVPDTSFLSKGQGVQLTEKGTIMVDETTLKANGNGIFAGGDVVTGTAWVIKAIAAGRRAASSIDVYLGGAGMIDETLLSQEQEVVVPVEPSSLPGKRAEACLLPVSERLAGFAEVDLGLTDDIAIEQAKRCLRCDLPIVVDVAKCVGCTICALWCSMKYDNAFNPSRAQIKIGELGMAQYAISFENECDVCGICARYCPHGALCR
jgi:NADPH-dependent glutamate synthase beta subunit-like oxidoreductase